MSGPGADDTTVDALVLSGGPPPDPGALRGVRPALVVAADLGLAHADGLGWPVDVAVGDFDSAPGTTVEAARRAGVEIVRHPADKDATDLDLAIDLAVGRGARSVLVVGGAGPTRLDHLLAAVLALAAPARSGVRVDAHLGPARLHVVDGGQAGAVRELRADPGEVVTLVPVGGDAVGVTTTGLRWPLHDEDLAAGTTRGVSNRVVAAPVRIEVRAGRLLVVFPGPE